MNPDVLIPLFAVVVSISGVVVSVFALVLNTRTANAQQELTRQNQMRQEELTRENQMRQEVGVTQWRHDLRDWASEAIDVLSEASYAYDAMPEDATPEEYFCQYLHRNWALIDRGRFFFPNKQPKYRDDPVKGYQGYRHEALDALWAAGIVMEETFKEDFDAKDKNDAVRCRRYVLEELQREFVSIMLKILDPWRYNEEIAKIIRARALISSETPRGAEALLYDIVPRVVRYRDCR